MTKPAVLALTLALAAGAFAATAHADGLPVADVDLSRSGVALPGGDTRYVALPTREGTLVAGVEPEGGRVLRSRFLPGRFTIPAVAYDGSADGLSADGSTIVLVRPRSRFPQAATAFAVLDADRLRVIERVTLRGDFSFDAISPAGSWLYLIQYLARRDPSRYDVRVYDLKAGRSCPTRSSTRASRTRRCADSP
jgi:hypothetical protein